MSISYILNKDLLKSASAHDPTERSEECEQHALGLCKAEQITAQVAAGVGLVWPGAKSTARPLLLQTQMGCRPRHMVPAVPAGFSQCAMTTCRPIFKSERLLYLQGEMARWAQKYSMTYLVLIWKASIAYLFRCEITKL